MHKLEHVTDLYLNMSVETHRAFEYVKPYLVDIDLLQPVQTDLERKIMSSIESLSHATLSLDKVVREVVDYVSTLKQSTTRYLDVIEKQKRLVSDSISPLLKANQAFIAIYGQDTFQDLENTSVRYFKKDANPIHIVNMLATAIIHRSPDDIRVGCSRLLNCKVTDSQLEYPALARVTTTSSESLSMLGYTTESFDQELQMLVGTKDAKKLAPHIALAEKKQDIIKQLADLHDNVTASINRVRPGKSFKSQMRSVMQEVADLQCYSVALSTVMFLLQSVSYSAYEAGYTLHLAELSHNNY